MKGDKTATVVFVVGGGGTSSRGDNPKSLLFSSCRQCCGQHTSNFLGDGDHDHLGDDDRGRVEMVVAVVVVAVVSFPWRRQLLWPLRGGW